MKLELDIPGSGAVKFDQFYFTRPLEAYFILLELMRCETVAFTEEVRFAVPAINF